MAYLFTRPNLATDLSTQLTPRSRQETDGGIFYVPTSVKYFFVTAMLWLGLGAIAATFWVGAFSIGATLSAWMSK